MAALSGYQFAHLSVFSAKGNSKNRPAAEIAAEAQRVPANCTHVEQPAPPTLLVGVMPLDALAEVERRVAAAKKAARGKGRGKGIRKDTAILVGVVFSHPAYCRRPPPGHEGEDRPHLDAPDELVRYERWRADTVKWAIEDCQKRGLDVLSVVEHRDEAHPHIHVLASPRLTTERFDARAAHPGYVAMAKAEAQGADVKVQKRAYNDAMRGWQDDYHSQVGIRHGLARIGPRRRRMDRAAWKQEQHANRLTADRIAAVDAAEADAQAKADAIIAEAREKARQQLAEADRQAQATATAAEAHRKAVEAAAAADAAKVRDDAEKAASARLRAVEARAKAMANEILDPVVQRDQAVTARERQVQAFETGIDAWQKGELLGAGTDDAGHPALSYRDQPTSDRLHPQLSPAFEQLWSFLTRVAGLVNERVQQALKPRETAVKHREDALAEQEGGLQRRKTQLDAREANLKPVEAALAERENAVKQRESLYQTLGDKLLRLAGSKDTLERQMQAALAAEIQATQKRNQGIAR